jgi:hypothetical protein
MLINMPGDQGSHNIVENSQVGDFLFLRNRIHLLF